MKRQILPKSTTNLPAAAEAVDLHTDRLHLEAVKVLPAISLGTNHGIAPDGKQLREVTRWNQQ